MRERYSPNGWTVDTLEAHFSNLLKQQDSNNKERFQAAREQVTLALTAAEKAISKAETANDKRFDSVNEFRSTLADQAATLLSRVEYTSQHQALIEKVSGLADRIQTLESKLLGKIETTAGLHQTWYGVGITISAIAAVVAIIISMYK